VPYTQHPVAVVAAAPPPGGHAAAGHAAAVYSYTALVPSDGNFTAFFVDVRCPDSGMHFTTQMSVVPMALPYKPCSAYGEEACRRLV
jgi:hypothetical protein